MVEFPQSVATPTSSPDEMGLPLLHHALGLDYSLTFQPFEEPRVQLRPLVYNPSVRGDHDTRSDRSIERIKSSALETTPDCAYLQLANDGERESERMPFDQGSELHVAAAPVVDHREDVGINGERTRRYIFGAHLIDFGDSRHESVALLIGRVAVVEGIEVRRLSRALEPGEVFEGSLTPELLWVEAED